MTMLKPLPLLAGLLMLATASLAQNKPMEMPTGYDAAREGVMAGKIDTLQYQSRTVGNSRKALVYTPPGFSKKKKYIFILKLVDCKDYYTIRIKSLLFGFKI